MNLLTTLPHFSSKYLKFSNSGLEYFLMLMTLTNCQHWQLQWLIPCHFLQWAMLIKIDCARALAASINPLPLFCLKHAFILLIWWTTQTRLIISVFISQFCLWTLLATIMKYQKNSRKNCICGIRKIPSFDWLIDSFIYSFIRQSFHWTSIICQELC